MSLSRRDPDHSGEKAPPLARNGAKFTRTVGAVDGEGYQSQSPRAAIPMPICEFGSGGGGGRIFGSHLRLGGTLMPSVFAVCRLTTNSWRWERTQTPQHTCCNAARSGWCRGADRALIDLDPDRLDDGAPFIDFRFEESLKFIG